jgi:hypothetical protein
MGLQKVSFDTSPATLGNFQFGECGDEPDRRPALFVGAFGELRPEPADDRLVRTLPII